LPESQLAGSRRRLGDPGRPDRDGHSLAAAWLVLPSFLEPRWWAEQALVAVVQEAYVNGVSTPRVDRLVERLGVAGFGKDQVSRLCRGTRNGSS